MAKATKPKKSSSPRKSESEKIIAAAFKLTEQHGWDELTLEEIARKAKVPFARLVDLYPSKTDIISGYMKLLDSRVLAALDGDAMDEPVRERLLDVLITRIEQMAPEKKAIKRIRASISDDPGIMGRLNKTALRSQMKMLAAAGGSVEGMSGIVRAQGLVYQFSQAVKVWLDDDDPGMARTMAELDRRLRAGEQTINRIKGGIKLARMARSFGKSFCGQILDQRRARKERATDDHGPDANPEPVG